MIAHQQFLENIPESNINDGSPLAIDVCILSYRAPTRHKVKTTHHFDIKSSLLQIYCAT